MPSGASPRRTGGFSKPWSRLIDDAVFDTVMTSERIAQGTAGRITRLVDGGVANAQRLMEIKAEVNYASGLLAEVANVSDPDLIEPIVERFVASSAALSRNLGALPDTPETARARREVEDLLSFGRGGDNIFETRRDELTGVAGAVSAARAPSRGSSMAVSRKCARCSPCGPTLTWRPAFSTRPVACPTAV